MCNKNTVWCVQTSRPIVKENSKARKFAGIGTQDPNRSLCNSISRSRFVEGGGACRSLANKRYLSPKNYPSVLLLSRLDQFITELPCLPYERKILVPQNNLQVLIYNWSKSYYVNWWHRLTPFSNVGNPATSHVGRTKTKSLPNNFKH